HACFPDTTFAAHREDHPLLCDGYRRCAAFRFYCFAHKYNSVCSANHPTSQLAICERQFRKNRLHPWLRKGHCKQLAQAIPLRDREAEIHVVPEPAKAVPDNLVVIRKRERLKMSSVPPLAVEPFEHGAEFANLWVWTNRISDILRLHVKSNREFPFRTDGDRQ